jgi:DNA-directed RNA polymerase specialized sigma24 family protein
MTDADEALSTLLPRREELVRFVRARVESDVAAEEIVQSAFLRGVESTARASEDCEADASRPKARQFRAPRRSCARPERQVAHL